MGDLQAEGDRDQEIMDYLNFLLRWKGSIRWVTSLLLTRKFQIDCFKITFLGGLKLQLG